MWGLDIDVNGCLEPEDLIDITEMETENMLELKMKFGESELGDGTFANRGKSRETWGNISQLLQELS